MDSIYSEMYTRNTEWLTHNPVIYDPLLLDTLSDSRKCIALIAHNDIFLLDIDPITSICSPLSSFWMCPRIHSTFIVLRGWNSSFISEDWSPLKNIIQSSLLPYDIIFDQVIPVKTGLLLCGTPSININIIRDQIRDSGYETNVLYKCDIFHTTILRWTHPLDQKDQDTWLTAIMKLPKRPYAKITVTSLDIIKASWSMDYGTTHLLDSISLS